VNADLNISTTTAERIDELIAEAGRLRQEYAVPTGFQRGPFFDIQTERFALLAIDTGIVKRIDTEEQRWLDDAVARARGKLTIAIVGHPFYAGGYDQRPGYEGFQPLYNQLRAAGVNVFMAGDTHDLERYVEPPDPTGYALQHFVNGGGGAYLSFGSALAWPAAPALATWAYYPSSAWSWTRSSDTRRGGSVPPGGGPAASMRGRSRPNGCRRCSTTTPRRSSRASSKSASNPIK
jgi:hypothetical protein